jgi:hypothetical protein
LRAQVPCIFFMLRRTVKKSQKSRRPESRRQTTRLKPGGTKGLLGEEAVPLEHTILNRPFVLRCQGGCLIPLFGILRFTTTQLRRLFAVCTYFCALLSIGERCTNGTVNVNGLLINRPGQPDHLRPALRPLPQTWTGLQAEAQAEQGWLHGASFWNIAEL